MSDLVHYIYSSVQTHVLQPAEIEALIEQSRSNNKRQHITGVLLHVGTTFFQVLEGSTAALETLYAKILRDSRHTRITSIIREPISRRYFGDSTMSLVTLSPRELAAALEEEDPGRMEELLADLDEGRAKRLLRAFSQGRWRARLRDGEGERQVVA